MMPREAEKTLRSLIAGGLRKSFRQLEDRIALSNPLAVYLVGEMRLSVVMC
jgi:hypothetical protein